MLKLLRLGALLATLSPMVAHAACSDLLIDRAGAVSDKAAVTAAAHRLADTATEVRIRTIPSRKLTNSQFAKNIDEFENDYRTTCPDWLAGGKLRSNVFLMLYVDNHTSPPWVGVYYGNGL